MSSASGWLIAPSSFDAIFDEPGSIRALALLRLLLGPATVLHLTPDLWAVAHGTTYDEHFFVPWSSVLPAPPGWAQIVLLVVGAAGGLGLAFGWHTRAAGVLAVVGVAGNLALSQHHFRHNREFLIILLAVVTLSDSGRVLSLDARRRRAAAAPSGGPAPADRGLGDRATIWPLWLLRILVSSVYFASGFSKLIDPDWFGGLVLWDRSVRHAHLVTESWLPGSVADLVIDVATTRGFHTVTSPIVVGTELFIAVGLWIRPIRLLAALTAVVFHVSIELTAAVEVFSLAALAALVIWVTPSTRDRVVTVDPGWVPWLRRLDWTGRFRVEPVPGAVLTVVDRDGRVHTGRAARWLVTSRLPVLFPFVAPLRWWWR